MEHTVQKLQIFGQFLPIERVKRVEKKAQLLNKLFLALEVELLAETLSTLKDQKEGVLVELLSQQLEFIFDWFLDICAVNGKLSMQFVPKLKRLGEETGVLHSETLLRESMFEEGSEHGDPCFELHRSLGELVDVEVILRKLNN